MNKIKVTSQQRANAIEARDVMWPSVPPENVPRFLEIWRVGYPSAAVDCGTIACFGGWSELWPSFREQLGLTPSDQELSSMEKLVSLYGPPGFERDDCGDTEDLFSRWGGHCADWTFKGTDHQLVTNRLNWLIENSEVL